MIIWPLNQRYRIFLFPRISSFLCIFDEFRMNEWKSCFFFPLPEKKNSCEIEWMNGIWTFPGKKTHKKNTHTHTPICTDIGRQHHQKKKTQLAQTQQNTTNIKTVSCGTNVAIFERQYRVMLTERESNRLDLPGKFCRTLIIGKLV